MTIVNANALHLPFADGIAQVCVTSPPYFGLRDYGTAGQIGLEQSPAAYVANIVAVMREVRRVLHPSGVLFLNLGDSYYGSTMTGGNSGINASGGANGFKQQRQFKKSIGPHQMTGGDATAMQLKPKDLIGIPWAVAKALQEPYYVGRIKSERDRVWLAATIDAEGTICGFTHVRKDDGSTRTGVHVTITNSNMRMLNEAHRIWPAALSDHNQAGEGHIGKLDTWRWIAHGVDDKSLLMRELYPYLVCKQKQALLAYNFFEMSKNAKHLSRTSEAESVKGKRALIVDLLSQLNHLEDVDIPGWCVVPPSPTEPGWYLRSDIIWAKPNPMPESVTDRPTKAHEYVFLLSKRPAYYYDSEAVAEPATETEIRNRATPDKAAVAGITSNGTGLTTLRSPHPTRNRRSVWAIATQPYKESHFATMPPKLAELCILAGSSAKGCCPKCRAPWERVVERTPATVLSTGSEYGNEAGRNDGNRSMLVGASATTLGWRPTCSCEAGDPIPCIALDPFSGSGTTGRVAVAHGRRYIGTELNLDYIGLHEQRMTVQTVMELNQS